MSSLPWDYYPFNLINNQPLCIASVPTFDEIHKVVKKLGALKAPGPDGMHAFFFQNCWDIVGTELSLLIADIFREGRVPASINDTLISLIPKTEDAHSMQQFRPISLCNTSYKIIAKTIANRLKASLPQRLSPFQNSFLPGRSTCTNAIIANEILHTFKGRKGKRGWFILKLDLEKAYDKLEWSFLRNALHSYGLTLESVNLIMSCVCTISSSVLVNGSPTDHFYPSRGIRQGDPLSPYLFIICMDILSKLILEATEQGKWIPFSLGNNKTSISHLLFADDILLCGEASKENLCEIQRVLNCFCALSGQSISLPKSKILFSGNTRREVREEIVNLLGIGETDDISPYLGFPLMSGRVKKGKVNFIIQKLKKKLCAWKASCLSKAGRLTLIKSTLNSIPNYFMQALPLPKACTKELNTIMAKFLWGKKGEQRGMHLVGWKGITRPVSKGGLGLRCCNALNKAHLLKLWWRFMEDSNSLDIQVLRDKYITREGHLKAFSNGSFLWKGLGSTWNAFKSSICWGVGNGEKISLWNDKWLHGRALRSIIHGPLALHEQQLKLSACISLGEWNTLLPDQVANLCHSIQIFPHLQDFPYSELAINGKFNFGKALDLLDPHDDSMISAAWVWNLDIPPKLRFFLWLTVLDRLPHCKTLASRGLLTSNSCSVCPGLMEDTEHILRSCTAAVDVWNLIQPGIPSNFFNLPFQEWLTGNCKKHPVPHSSNILIPWHILFPHILWCLWIRRNEAIFSLKQLSPTACLDKAKALALDFILYQDKSSTHSPSSPSLSTWTPPNTSHWFLNTDGSFVSQDEPAGIAGVARDSQGNWILGFGKSCFAANPLMTELLAIYEALKLIQNKQWLNVIILSDCMNAVQQLTESHFFKDELFNLILTCRQLLLEMPTIEVQFTPRQANQVADKMAKLCRTSCAISNDIVTFESPMDELVILYEEDRPP